MHRKLKVICCIFSVAVFLLPARTALSWIQACTTNEDGDICFHQAGNCVSWSINHRGSDDVEDFELVHEAVRKAFAAWNAQGCSYIKFYETPISRCECKHIGCNVGGKNVNLIVWCEDYWPFHDRPSAVALTSVIYEDATGEIVDSDVALNGANFTFGIVEEGQDCDGITDIQDTMTHEAGHMLGFDESDVEGATMWPYTHACDIEKRTLSENDIEGLCALYPIDNDPLECLSPVGGLEICEGGCGCSVVAMGSVDETLLNGFMLGTLLFCAAVMRKKFFKVK